MFIGRGWPSTKVLESNPRGRDAKLGLTARLFASVRTFTRRELSRSERRASKSFTHDTSGMRKQGSMKAHGDCLICSRNPSVPFFLRFHVIPKATSWGGLRFPPFSTTSARERFSPSFTLPASKEDQRCAGQRNHGRRPHKSFDGPPLLCLLLHTLFHLSIKSFITSQCLNWGVRVTHNAVINGNVILLHMYAPPPANHIDTKCKGLEEI